MRTQRIGFILLGIIGLIALITFSLIPPIIQDEAYHNFSDESRIFGIPNFWNVISNLPFLALGVWGIIKLQKSCRRNTQFLIFLIGIIFVAIGSGYYHFNPTSETLIWDRLPMTVAFTALISLVISEFINNIAGNSLLIPLILLGLVSILFWVQTGDLRIYAFVQFYPVLAIPIILFFFRSESKSTKGFWLLLASYIVAKLFEEFDLQIHQTLKIISGHSLKHLVISVGIYFLIDSYLPNKVSSQSYRTLG